MCWRVVFPDVEPPAAASYLREVAASACSPATIRSYAYALLHWFRFLHARFVGWERAPLMSCPTTWTGPTSRWAIN